MLNFRNTRVFDGKLLGDSGTKKWNTPITFTPKIEKEIWEPTRWFLGGGGRRSVGGGWRWMESQR